MNNEIKEIIETIECYQNEKMCMIILSQKQNKGLLNYITNLQEENKKLLQKSYSDDVIITKAIEEIKYMETNADITEIGSIKLKQILKGQDND